MTNMIGTGPNQVPTNQQLGAAAYMSAADIVAPAWRVVSGAVTAVAGDWLLIDTTSATATITLPAAPAANDIVRFADYAGTWAVNKVTFGRNGLKIMGLSEDYDITTANLNGVMTYIDTTQGWKHL